MIINKHGSFYIRSNWPTKILAALQSDTHIFSPNRELDAVDSLGVGRVMVKSMRYWSNVLGLSSERHDNLGVLTELTELGASINDKDKYFESKDLLWLLHRNLSRNIDNATAWYWAFNIFDRKQFNKHEFVDSFFAFLTNEGLSYEKKIVSKEFDCFKNTYVSGGKNDIKRLIEEDTTPFFAPLHLITNLGNGYYQLNSPSERDIDVEVFMYCILKDNESTDTETIQIPVEHIINDAGQIGKYMNMSFSTVLSLLQKAENRGYITLVNNFGNRYIEKHNYKAEDLLSIYFDKLGA